MQNNVRGCMYASRSSIVRYVLYMKTSTPHKSRSSFCRGVWWLDLQFHLKAFTTTVWSCEQYNSVQSYFTDHASSPQPPLPPLFSLSTSSIITLVSLTHSLTGCCSRHLARAWGVSTFTLKPIYDCFDLLFNNVICNFVSNLGNYYHPAVYILSLFITEKPNLTI